MAAGEGGLDDLLIGDDTDLICHRAEVFRSKLIADFHLLDTINEAGSKIEAPKYTTADLMGKWHL